MGNVTPLKIQNGREKQFQSGDVVDPAFLPTSGITAFPPNFINGLLLSNNAGDTTNSCDIAAGNCTDHTNAKNIVSAALSAKNSAKAWALGSSAGWMDESRTSTITATIASPAVVSWTAHGLIAGNAVVFSTTGALPTGITAGTIYYVISAGLATNSFEISATIGGSAVNTSGTQSGTHTAVALPGFGNNTYFPYAILRSDTGVVDNLLSLATGLSATATLTIASPCVVTLADHGFQVGTPVIFTTTGTLPTGIVAGTRYYVNAPVTTSTFNIAATINGTSINTTGSQSGTHTVSSTPLLPTSYDFYRRIGSLIRGGSNTILNGTWYDSNRRFDLNVPINNLPNSAIANTSANLQVLTLPVGIYVEALFNISISASSTQINVLVTSPQQTDTAASTTIRTISTYFSGGGGTTSASQDITKVTNRTGQIRWRADSNAGPTTTIGITSFGYKDFRLNDGA